MARRDTRGGRRPGSGRPRSPAATLAAIEELAAGLGAGTFRLSEWSDAELDAVVQALKRLASPFEVEQFGRWQDAAERDE